MGADFEVGHTETPLNRQFFKSWNLVHELVAVDVSVHNRKPNSKASKTIQRLLETTHLAELRPSPVPLNKPPSTNKARKAKVEEKEKEAEKGKEKEEEEKEEEEKEEEEKEEEEKGEEEKE